MEDTSPALDWSLLLPEISWQLLDGTLTAQDLSAFIIILFVVVSSAAIAHVCARAAAATRSIDFLLDLLEGIAPEEAVNKRQAIRAAAQRWEHEGALWSRFDQSLVVSADGRRLYGSQEPGNFFNVNNLARDPTDNRLVAALPGLLTSFGILATVVVLQLTLSGTDRNEMGALPSDDVAVAFSTSVWGVGSAIALQALSEAIRWLLHWRLGYLTQRIGGLFPRYTDAHVLINLEQDQVSSEVTHVSLQSLVDNHVQATLDNMIESVQARLWEAATPALAQLGEAAETLAARSRLPEVERMVAQQHESLCQASAAFGAVAERLDDSVDLLADKCANRLDRLVSNAENQVAALDDRIGHLCDEHLAITAKADAVLQLTLEGAEQLQAQADQTRERDKATKELIRELDTARYNIENSVDELKRRGQFANKTLDQLEAGYTAFLEGLSSSAADSGERMSNLLIEYSQQITEQARERMDDWKRMTEEFSSTMTGALREMQSALRDLPGPPATKKRRATPRKRAAASAKRVADGD